MVENGTSMKSAPLAEVRYASGRRATTRLGAATAARTLTETNPQKLKTTPPVASKHGKTLYSRRTEK